ncbi:type 1 fimbrial protein [Burkholderia arboris]|uniref:fimbrial protein n=1 Tax=Burkholderia arboris TaxID=488730 RepID=UPI001CA4321A|nr:fimbrial protein [Burkholderia arboris]MBY8610509.1 type 1 fimbrial protein [Burkholderia arboris]
MQSKLLSTLLLVGAVTTSQAVFAADGTITFSGNVTAQTCTINGNGSGAKNFTVTLPTVSAGSLATSGATVGTTPFSIALTGCTPTTGAGAVKSVHAYFETGPTIDSTTGNLILATGGATNVEIQLLNGADQSAIKLGQVDASQNSKAVNVSAAGAATLQFYAQYYATGAATAGAANSSVMYTIAYQ